MSTSKVLVTGATGFLGGWVVEGFQLADIGVRAGIRNWHRAVRLARRPTDLVPCDVLAPDQLEAAMQSCDAVVHCAVGSRQVTVDGTRNVLAAARRRGIRRVVHLSSVAVYGAASGRLDESCPHQSDGNRYAQAKIDAEAACREFIEDGLSVVILRPGIVYGPFGEAWTISFAQRLASGRWGTLGPAGEGKCNLVYVTDVVQAIARALSRDIDLQPGAAFNIVGEQVVTWNEYFERFNAALGRSPLAEVNPWRFRWRSRLLAPVRAAARLALARFGTWVTAVHAHSTVAARWMKGTESSLKLTPTTDQLNRFRIDAEYSIARAREQLGYRPRIPLDLGIQRSVEWLDHYGLLY